MVMSLTKNAKKIYSYFLKFVFDYYVVLSDVFNYVKREKCATLRPDFVFLVPVVN